jgi:hypothetical protein
MNRFWNHGSERLQDNTAGGEDQLSMIPNWSVVLAIIVFGAVQYLFHGVLPHHKHELLPMRLLMGYSWGTAFASYVLLVGYVSRDVRRRRQNAGRAVDSDRSGDAGRYRGRGLLPVAAADDDSLSALQHGDYLERALLPAMPVPTGSGLRTMLPRGADYGCVLHAVRT